MIDWSSMSIEDKFKRTKIKMYERSPFFSYILLHLRFVEDSDLRVLPFPTMGVTPNGILYWHKDFVKKLSEDELSGVIAHEVMHIALFHLERGKTRDMDIFNTANDLVVNDIITNQQYGDYTFKLPEQGLIPDAEHKFLIPQLGLTIENIHEKSSEEIYDEIYKVCPTIKVYINYNGKGTTLPGKGLSKKDLKEIQNKLKGFDKHIHDADKGGQKESESLKVSRQQEWQKIIATATQLARQQGKLPSALERRIEDVLDSKVNWKQKLYRYVVSQIPFDFTWSLPSKRGMGAGIYLPRTVRESVHIIVSFDTSGSIGDEELKEFLSELKSIGESFVNINLDIIVCDADVHETYSLTKTDINDILALKMSGGGGTSHLPVYEHVENSIRDARILINFTDGYTDFPTNPEKYGFESLWVICKHGCSEKDVPFGEVIKLSD